MWNYPENSNNNLPIGPLSYASFMDMKDGIINILRFPAVRPR